MNRWCLIGFLMLVPLAESFAAGDAADPTGSPTAGKHSFELDFMGGAALPNNGSSANPLGYSTNYNLGFGGGVRALLFPAGSALGLGFTFEYQSFSGTIPGITGPGIAFPSLTEDRESFDWLTSAEIRFLHKGNFQPYILAGAGFSLNHYHLLQNGFPSTSGLNPVFQAGAGFEVPLGEKMGFFLEAEENFVIAVDLVGGFNYSFSYTPLQAGMTFDL